MSFASVGSMMLVVALAALLIVVISFVASFLRSRRHRTPTSSNSSSRIEETFVSELPTRIAKSIPQPQACYGPLDDCVRSTDPNTSRMLAFQPILGGPAEADGRCYYVPTDRETACAASVNGMTLLESSKPFYRGNVVDRDFNATRMCVYGGEPSCPPCPRHCVDGDPNRNCYGVWRFERTLDSSTPTSVKYCAWPTQEEHDNYVSSDPKKPNRCPNAPGCEVNYCDWTCELNKKGNNYAEAACDYVWTKEIKGKCTPASKEMADAKKGSECDDGDAKSCVKKCVYGDWTKAEPVPADKYKTCGTVTYFQTRKLEYPRSRGPAATRLNCDDPANLKRTKQRELGRTCMECEYMCKGGTSKNYCKGKKYDDVASSSSDCIPKHAGTDVCIDYECVKDTPCKVECEPTVTDGKSSCVGTWKLSDEKHISGETCTLPKSVVEGGPCKVDGCVPADCVATCVARRSGSPCEGELGHDDLFPDCTRTPEYDEEVTSKARCKPAGCETCPAPACVRSPDSGRKCYVRKPTDDGSCYIPDSDSPEDVPCPSDCCEYRQTKTISRAESASCLPEDTTVCFKTESDRTSTYVSAVYTLYKEYGGDGGGANICPATSNVKTPCFGAGGPSPTLTPQQYIRIPDMCPPCQPVCQGGTPANACAGKWTILSKDCIEDTSSKVRGTSCKTDGCVPFYAKSPTKNLGTIVEAGQLELPLSDLFFMDVDAMKSAYDDDSLWRAVDVQPPPLRGVETFANNNPLRKNDPKNKTDPKNKNDKKPTPSPPLPPSQRVRVKFPDVVIDVGTSRATFSARITFSLPTADTAAESITDSVTLTWTEPAPPLCKLWSCEDKTPANGCVGVARWTPSPSGCTVPTDPPPSCTEPDTTNCKPCYIKDSTTTTAPKLAHGQSLKLADYFVRSDATKSPFVVSSDASAVVQVSADKTLSVRDGATDDVEVATVSNEGCAGSPLKVTWTFCEPTCVAPTTPADGTCKGTYAYGSNRTCVLKKSSPAEGSPCDVKGCVPDCLPSDTCTGGKTSNGCAGIRAYVTDTVPPCKTPLTPAPSCTMPTSECVPCFALNPSPSPLAVPSYGSPPMSTPLSQYFSYDGKSLGAAKWTIAGSGSNITVDSQDNVVIDPIGNSDQTVHATITNESCAGSVTLTWTEPKKVNCVGSYADTCTRPAGSTQTCGGMGTKAFTVSQQRQNGGDECPSPTPCQMPNCTFEINDNIKMNVAGHGSSTVDLAAHVTPKDIAFNVALLQNLSPYVIVDGTKITASGFNMNLVSAVDFKISADNYDTKQGQLTVTFTRVYYHSGLFLTYDNQKRLFAAEYISITSPDVALGKTTKYLEDHRRLFTNISNVTHIQWTDSSSNYNFLDRPGGHHGFYNIWKKKYSTMHICDRENCEMDPHNDKDFV